jgi:hypothetical protein
LKAKADVLALRLTRLSFGAADLKASKARSCEPKGREAMIEIAGGIVLAVLFLALLPAIIQGALWLAAVGLVLVVVIGAGWLLLAGAQSPEGLGAELIVAGVFLVWLHYEIKARREIAAEEVARKAQQLSPAED